jgi:hypothetical protein
MPAAHSPRSFRLLVGLVGAFGWLSATTAGASDPEVKMLVLRENGVGSASTAQKYIDELMGAFARVNGWPAAVAAYHQDRGAAQSYIEQSKPSFGFLSLGAYLGLRTKHGLLPVGKASISGGGEQYYVISKSAQSLVDCKGKTLATNHGTDARFIDSVVFGDAAKLSDFEVVSTSRPVQTLKKVTRDEAVCALVDDAQMSELRGMDGAEHVKPVWFSAKLPPVVVVAFPGVESASFAANLDKVCRGEGKIACDKAGVRSLERASRADFDGLHAAYGS